jgi:hypothetical protein
MCVVQSFFSVVKLQHRDRHRLAMCVVQSFFSVVKLQHRDRHRLAMCVVQSFFSVVKPGRHGPDAPPLAPACARCRFAPRARRAAGARHGVVVVPWLGPREGSAHCAEPPPPSVQPAARPDPTGPSAEMIVDGDRHRGQWSRPEGPVGSGVTA